MPLYDELGGDSSFLRESLRFSYTVSFLRYKDIQHSNGKRGQSTFFIPRSKHFPSAHINKEYLADEYHNGKTFQCSSLIT